LTILNFVYLFAVENPLNGLLLEHFYFYLVETTSMACILDH